MDPKAKGTPLAEENVSPQEMLVTLLPKRELPGTYPKHLLRGMITLKKEVDL